MPGLQRDPPGRSGPGTAPRRGARDGAGGRAKAPPLSPRSAAARWQCPSHRPPRAREPDSELASGATCGGGLGEGNEPRLVTARHLLGIPRDLCSKRVSASG